MSFNERAVFLLHKNSSSLLHPVGRKRILKMIESEKRKSGGRPRKVIKRESATGIRFTKAEYFIIKQKASKAGVRITTYIRQTALDGKVIAKMSEEERHFVRQLIGMSNNLNQLTKKAHQEGLLTAVLLFEKYRNIIDELLGQLRR
jgi:hypothetical protein